MLEQQGAAAASACPRPARPKKKTTTSARGVVVLLDGLRRYDRHAHLHSLTRTYIQRASWYAQTDTSNPYMWADARCSMAEGGKGQERHGQGVWRCAGRPARQVMGQEKQRAHPESECSQLCRRGRAVVEVGWFIVFCFPVEVAGWWRAWSAEPGSRAAGRRRVGPRRWHQDGAREVPTQEGSCNRLS